MAEKKIHELPLADTIGENDIILIGNPSTGELKKATRGLLESYAKEYADGLVTGLLKVLLSENDTFYELPINTLLMYIAIYSSDSGGVKIGTSLDADDIVSDEIIDKATYTINEYFSGATTLYFSVPPNARIIIYKL